MRGTWCRSCAIVVVICSFSLAGSAKASPKTVGNTSIVVKEADAILKSSVRQLTVSDPVYWQERIETGIESAAEVTFLDGTTLSAGPGSKVTLDEFVYSPDPSKQKLVIGITKGIMRFATGGMNSKAYKIKAPGAIIGVRGTVLMVKVGPTSTTCSVSRGSVDFANERGTESVNIPSGNSSEVQFDRPGASPSPPAPTEEKLLQAEQELLVTLASSTTLQQTSAAQRNAQVKVKTADAPENECQNTRGCIAVEEVTEEVTPASPTQLR
jgi:hypothetical protein